MAERRHSRWVVTLMAGALVAAALGYAFWPRPTLVDMGQVTRGPMLVTINEEGRTQVHDPYVVSTPVAGRMMRLSVEPGDVVDRGDVVARMRPTATSALDARSREQARANVTAAEAALRVAEADLNKARADRDLAEANLERTKRLFDSGIVSQAALDADERSARAASAALDTARAAISMRVAELNNARAALINFDDTGLAEAIEAEQGEVLPLKAPVPGTILRIMQQSEITLTAGTPILEIGDIESGLEVVAELLSTDAVRISEGDRVVIDNWGGPVPLDGVVARIEPWGFTKTSALGVEEQRVNVTIRFLSPYDQRRALGHGFRVEVRIVTWEAPDALTVPAGALFRDGPQDWAVFVVQDGVARQRRVTVAANNGLTAAIGDGVTDGDTIVLYPPAGLMDGQDVAPRSAYR